MALVSRIAEAVGNWFARRRLLTIAIIVVLCWLVFIGLIYGGWAVISWLFG